MKISNTTDSTPQRQKTKPTVGLLEKHASPVTSWTSSEIPHTIRRPWDVFKNVAETQLEEKKPIYISIEVTDAISLYGSREIFQMLERYEQQSYIDVSLHDLSAFTHWSNHHHHAPSSLAPVVSWDALPDATKEKWVVDDKHAAICESARWAQLVSPLSIVDDGLPPIAHLREAREDCEV